MSYVSVCDRANNNCLVEVDAEDTVADLKKKIAVKMKIRNRHQILAYDGIALVCVGMHILSQTYVRMRPFLLQAPSHPNLNRSIDRSIDRCRPNLN